MAHLYDNGRLPAGHAPRKRCRLPVTATLRMQRITAPQLVSQIAQEYPPGSTAETDGVRPTRLDQHAGQARR